MDKKKLKDKISLDDYASIVDDVSSSTNCNGFGDDFLVLKTYISTQLLVDISRKILANKKFSSLAFVEFKNK